MIKSDIILLDVDGVLLNWVEAFSRYMSNQGYVSNNIISWEMDDTYGLKKEHILEHIMRFNNGHWEFGTLNPIPGAKKGINILKKYGYKLVAITASSTNPVSVSLRKSNLYWCFGNVFEAVHCVDLRESKDTHLADYEPTFWVEDKIENAVSGLKYGHIPILLEYPYNENFYHKNIIKARNWNDILNIILKKSKF